MLTSSSIYDYDQMLSENFFRKEAPKSHVRENSLYATNTFNLTDWISVSTQRMLLPCTNKGNMSRIAVLNH